MGLLSLQIVFLRMKIDIKGSFIFDVKSNPVVLIGFNPCHTEGEPPSQGSQELLILET